MKRFLLGLPLLFPFTDLLAQTTEQSPSAGETAGGAIAGFAGLGCSCIFCIVIFGIWIALALWVYKDAKSRGMDNAVLLTIVTVITGLLGLIIYLLMRPKGNLVPCPSCQKKRMEGSAKCPHCGNP